MIRKDGKPPMEFVTEEMAMARKKWADDYALKKKWNLAELTWDQIQEIKAQPGYQKAGTQ